MTVEEWLGEDNKLGIDIWHKKYQKNNETFEQWLDRVSLGDEKTRELIKEKKFIPGGRILSNVGLNLEKTGMTNCYSRGYVEDDYVDIMQTISDIGLTFKNQGGQGISLSKLRPKGAPVGENNYKSDGIIPFMKMFNEVTEGTSQGGARKGALLMSLDAWHKEAKNFITIKSQEGIIEKANLSLEIDDKFMECVDAYYRTGEVKTVTCKQVYSGHEVEWEVTPIEVFKEFIHNNWDWGDPGCLFVDKFRNYNLMEKVEGYSVETANPCGEQPLPKHGCCNLASINLSEFITDPYTENAEFSFSSFILAVREGINYLDKIIDLGENNHALPEQKEMASSYRNCGLGVMGYATMLMKMGLTYGSKEALKLTDIIFNDMFHSAFSKSMDLAIIKGPFPKYSNKIWESEIVKNHFSEESIYNHLTFNQMLRNCSLLSIAPTGSIATMLGESGGCEPEFAISYTRRTVGMSDNEDKYYTVYCKAAKEYMALHPDCKELPDYFVSSADIDPMNRIKTQAVMQKHVDTAISSTVNLPESATEEQMAQIYLEAWKQGLKGLTIFRNNCKRAGILTTDTPKKEEAKEKEADSATIKSKYPTLNRGDIIDCSFDLIGRKRKLITGCGSLHVLAFFDPATGEMMEVYLNKGSTGGCANFTTGLSRMISLLCRAGVDVYTIKDQLDSTGVCPSYATRKATKHDTSVGSCCPMAVGNALIEMYEELQRELDDSWETVAIPTSSTPAIPKPVLKEKTNNQTTKKTGIACPECGEPLEFEVGCQQCHNCGYSKCE